MNKIENAPFHVLIIDDDHNVMQSLVDLMQASGWKATGRTCAENITDLLGQYPIDVILSDVKMPGVSGLDLLADLKDIDAPPVVLISAHGDVAMAVEAMQNGAYSFIEKPYVTARLISVLGHAAEQQRLSQRNSRLLQQLSQLTKLDRILPGRSDAIASVRNQILDIADSDANILLIGETGTGKELVAHALHELSPRAAEPFFVINCATLNDDNFETRMFGVGNTGDGVFVCLDGGTLFLDEICDAPISVQAKLLRVIETGEIFITEPNERIRVDVRVISAINKNPEMAITDGKLRRDLYYRLSHVCLPLPSLRSRPDDVLMLLNLFLVEYARLYEVTPPDLSEQDIALLLTHNWPGNVRELRHVAERRVLASRRGRGSFKEAMQNDPDFDGIPATLREASAAFERELISRAIRSHKGRMDAIAEALGIGRRTLNEKMLKLGLNKKDLL